MVALLVILLVVAGLCLWTPEPKYQGKTASQWCRESKGGLDDVSFVAIKTMGKKAVPSLLHQLQLSNSPFHHRLVELSRFVPGAKMMPDEVLREKAQACLYVLGPEAEEAVPELISMLNSANDMDRQIAYRVLGEIHSRPEISVPALQNAIRRVRVLEQEYPVLALSRFGGSAKSVVPMLVVQMRYCKSQHHREFNTYYDKQYGYLSYAIKRIDPEAAAREGIK